LEGVGSPPLLIGRNVVLDELTPKVGESIRGELHVQPRAISPRVVFAKDNLSLAMIDLTNGPDAVTLVPTLLKAKHIDVKTHRAVQFRNEENRARIPPMNSLVTHGLLYRRRGGSVTVERSSWMFRVLAHCRLEFFPSNNLWLMRVACASGIVRSPGRSTDS
jgi:hypothetical protein